MKRCALITGCSSGIGRATALAFLEEGWDVYATARNKADLTSLAEAGCHTASLDVTEQETIDTVVERVLSEQPTLDCLVNNAGFSQPGAIEDVSTDRLHQQFDVNVYGPHRLSRAVLPHMRAHGDGTIINISSGLGQIVVPGYGAYSASKFALEAMSDALRAEVGTHGVDVVLVQPGLVSTSFHDRSQSELQTMARNPAYEALYRLLDDWHAFDEGGISFVTAADVADAIVNAASATQPSARYRVGPTARVAGMARLLPARVRDGCFKLVMRVGSLVDR